MRILALLLAQQVAADSELPCVKVPGPVVAAALGGRLIDTRSPGWTDPGESRCRYRLAPLPGSKDTMPRFFILWTYPDSDYDGLREATPADRRRDVPGVGDAAHTYIDPDTKRYWITAVKRGRICLSATASDFESAKKLALLALSRY